MIEPTARQWKGYPANKPKTAFGEALSEARQRRRLSQSALADAAGFNHSYVSRIETGGRMPSRYTVECLISALQPNEQTANNLLALAGYLPTVSAAAALTEPTVTRLAAFLSDGDVPPEQRDAIRQAVTSMLAAVGRQT